MGRPVTGAIRSPSAQATRSLGKRTHGEQRELPSGGVSDGLAGFRSAPIPAAPPALVRSARVYAGNDNGSRNRENV